MTPRGTLLTCLLLGLVLVGCEVLVVPPESTATPEDVGAAPGPTQVEMTIVLTDGVAGGPLVGSKALMGPQEQLTNGAGKATLLVPAGQVFTAALYTNGHRPLYVNGVAADEAFLWPTSSISEATLASQVTLAGGTLDEGLGVVNVSLMSLDSGANATLSAPWAVAYHQDGAGAVTPGATLSPGSPGVVTFSNVPAGTAVVTSADAQGRPCDVLASPIAESFSLQVEPGATTTVSFLCGDLHR